MTMNWRDLNKSLPQMPEETVRDLLQNELVAGRRPTVVVRLHQRLTALRALRERNELLAQLRGDLTSMPAP